MPRPIESLNNLLTLLCIAKGTFNNIPDLRDGNLWYASDGQLADAVERGMQELQRISPDHAQGIIEAIVGCEDGLRRRLLEANVCDLCIHFTFSACGKHIILSQDFVDGPSNREEWKELPGICVVCYEAANIELPSCHCLYCYRCLRSLIRYGLSQEDNFPPRCCQPLWPSEIILAKRPTLYNLHRQLSEEYRFPSGARVYCADIQCGTFVGPRDPNVQRWKCPVCDIHTCAMCYNHDHPGRLCPVEDE